jgi:uncharacterized protein
MQTCIMLARIMMKFVNRIEELGRLDRLKESADGGLAVVYGRRRVGKTRLLLEWSAKHGGLYTVADQSTANVQRRYFAEVAGERLPGFADVEYPDWRSLLTRLAREARTVGWRGPVIFDEVPYLVNSSPELPSLLQRWIDHEARQAGLVVAIAGSSQRMMQGFVLSGDAPLYGRAKEILELRPIDPAYIPEIFVSATGADLVETYAAWGGIPRYWELAADLGGSVQAQIERLVLDPMGPLHREPDRLLIEEIPPALEARPVLDAIGAGAHRVSEIGGRVGRPATSMSRPLERLIEMDLVRREVPFGEPEKQSRRSLYKIDDPFFRLWFRVVAPHRGQLASSTVETRLRLLERFWSGLVAQAWEDLCRKRLPFLDPSTDLGKQGPWLPGARWWRGEMPEWDVVSESLDGERLLLGEAKWSARPYDRGGLEKATRTFLSKPVSRVSAFKGRDVVRVLFVPETDAKVEGTNLLVVTAADLIE